MTEIRTYTEKHMEIHIRSIYRKLTGKIENLFRKYLHKSYTRTCAESLDRNHLQKTETEI